MQKATTFEPFPADIEPGCVQEASVQVGYRIDRFMRGHWVTVSYVDVADRVTEELGLVEARRRLDNYRKFADNVTYRLVRHTLTETIEEIA